MCYIHRPCDCCARAAQSAVMVQANSFLRIGFASQEAVLSGVDSFMVFQTADCVISRADSSARIALRCPDVVGRSFKN